MRTLCLIPFLAVPFFLPEAPAGLRILSILALGISAFLWLSPLGDERDKPQDRLSPFHIIVSIGVLLLYFGVSDPWYRSCVWPVAVAGALGMFASCRSTFPVRFGLVITAAGLWLLVYLFAVNPNFFPIQAYAHAISQVYPPSSLKLDTGIVLPAAIVVPDTCAGVLLFKMATAVTTTLLVSVAFTNSRNPFHFLFWLPLIGWSLISMPLLGKTLFFLLALIVTVFLILTKSMRTFLSKKNLILYAFLLAFCLLGSLGFLDRISSLFNPVYDALDRFVPQLFSTRIVGEISSESLYLRANKMGSDWVIPAAISIGLLLLIVETGLKRTKEDLRYPLGISLLVISSFSIGRSLHIWLVNPLTWIALICLQNAHRAEKDKLYYEEESGSALLDIPWAPWAAAGFAGFLCLVSVWALYPNWRSETALQQYALDLPPGDRATLLKEAVQRTPYRGDLVALYVTDSISSLYSQGILPPAPEPDKLASFLNLAAKQGFVPLLGYSRLSGLLLLHSFGEQSIGVLMDSVAFAPDQAILQELFADSLDNVGRKEKALMHYRICANLSPTLPRIREKMARIYQAMGKSDEARQEYTNLLTLDPTSHVKDK